MGEVLNFATADTPGYQYNAVDGVSAATAHLNTVFGSGVCSSVSIDSDTGVLSFNKTVIYSGDTAYTANDGDYILPYNSGGHQYAAISASVPSPYFLPLSLPATVVITPEG
jgi:hypothetical protein